ncbi:MAG: caspase family protein [Sulfurimonas sp.]|nr:caspase family protein [Sulfurimonas sp.]
MLKKILLLLLTIVLFLSFVGCSRVKSVLHIKEPIKIHLSEKNVKGVIESAAKKRGWNVKEVAHGKIEAEYARSAKYMARVNIFYDSNNYEIEYLDSKNLRYDGVKIHKTYNSLVSKLRKEINVGFKRISKGKAPRRTPKETPKVVYAKASKPVSKVRKPTYKTIRRRFGNARYNFRTASEENLNSYALVIGIDKYKQNPRVIYADTSARAFAELVNITFGVPKENIILLLNDEATSGELKAKLEIIKELADSRGNLYIYYAGHGVPSKSGETYILPYDMSADAMYLEPNLKLKNIYAKLSKIKVKNVFVFIDSCFSGKDDRGGLLYKGVAPIIRGKKTVVNTNKITVFSAGKSDDFANDYRDKKQRMFSYFLIEGLSKGETKLNKVYPDIKQQVKKNSLKKGIGYIQVPQIYGNKKRSLY